MVDLFERQVKTLGKHIRDALKEELNRSVVASFATTASVNDIRQMQKEVYLMYALFLCNLLIPVVVIVTGRIMWKHYPKNINGLVGYRTTRSMKNMDTWKFANEHCGRLWYKMGLFMLVFSVLVSVLLLRTNDNIYSMISLIFVLLQCIILIVSIIPTELALKKMFYEDGTRK
ncbi:SdpI family protein [uncultured Catenibacterium sp.]|uniref:SdpI family protein n=1 Tax=uncultured Catenibacterium sp. TaxID=286142 RepID=UPI0025CD200E|nr:SdpI family protein [uncultured Catenibacterium sp.]